jgi:hypothetical protein
MKLKTTILLIVLLIVLLFGLRLDLFAQIESYRGNGFGAGIMIGEPTGVTLKYNNFPVIGLAWSMVDDDFSIFCDYWIINRNLKGPVDFYIGAGGKLKLRNNNARHKNDRHENVFGVRVPFGLQFFPVEKIELFAEIVPGISLIPETAADIDAAIGVRYYFW